ncbi:multidrug effflux MFS transporter [Roseomonas gilardii subsp. gilardii]|uniref:multidrug effflux MFS transporter n=1 Tax=Roseomonas gilardii TaxID=257708 RepID=UPI001FFB60A5|nr:multidrug effflux MFS transporter [Roseomonas gilardii]UPG72555.1 multidrug effflux MFS transporter [Roseomonas gilardii subsp. gilardii]
MAFRHKGLAFTVFLGALSALPPLSIDMGLPGFPALEADLGATPSEATQTLSIFLLGFACGPLLLGPLSDRFGRRPVLLAGLLIFALAGFGCALAGSPGTLLFWRLVQGIGAGAGATLPFAIVRDLFDGTEARLRMSYVTLVLGVGPIVAPMLGTLVLALGGWRAIYGTLGLGGLVLLLVTAWGFAESAPDGRHHSLHPRQILMRYGEVLRRRVFLGHALSNAACFGTLFAYISGSPAVLMGQFGVAPGGYSLLFACSAVTLMLGSALSGRLARAHVPGRLVSRIALALTSCGAVLALLLTLLGALGPASLVPLAAIGSFGFGLLAPNATHGALQPMGRMAGAASAALRSLQMLFGALASGLVGFFYVEGSALSLTAVMAGCALLGLGLQLALLPGREPLPDPTASPG